MALLDALRSWWGSRGSTKTPRAPEPRGDLLETFADDLRSSLDQGVDLPPTQPTSVETPAETVYDESGPGATFAGIASNYAKPIKDFVFDLSRGTATKDWIEVCMPVLGSLLHGAQSLELENVVARMGEFSDALALAEAEEGRHFDEDSRRLILSRYDALARAMPTTFDAGVDCHRRESIIIHSLLRQIPQVGHVTFEKLYGAGLTSLEVLLLANAEDMSATTDVPVELCERICRKLQDYRNGVGSQTSKSAEQAHIRRLAELLVELKQHHGRLQEVTDGSGVEKRKALGDRRACMLKIDVLLAEMGEVSLVEEMHTIAFERRIERLERYLGPDALSVEGPVQVAIDGAQGNR